MFAPNANKSRRILTGKKTDDSVSCEQDCNTLHLTCSHVKKLLPADVEKLVFSFCALDDLGAFALCSRQSERLVCAILSCVTIAHWTSCSDPDRFEFATCGLRLLSKPGLGRLRSLNIRGLLMCLMEELIGRVVDKHRGTLENVISTFNPPDVILCEFLAMKLSFCPNLRELMLGVYHEKDTKTVLNQIVRSGCCLVKFRCPEIPLPTQPVIRILKKSRLEWLELCDISLPVLKALEQGDLRGLRTLRLRLNVNDSLTNCELCKLIARLPVLTDLEVSSFWDTKMSTLLLPHVTKLTLGGDVFPLVAPRLKEFAGCASVDRVIDLVRFSPDLEKCIFWMSIDEIDSEDTVALSMTAGCWRNLQLLTMNGRQSALRINLSLLVPVFPHWTRLRELNLTLKCSPLPAANSTGSIVSVLRHAPLLQWLHLGFLEYDSIMTQMASQLPDACAKACFPVIVARELENINLSIGDDSLFRSVQFPRLRIMTLVGPVARFEMLGLPSVKQLFPELVTLHLFVSGGVRPSSRIVSKFKKLHPKARVLET